MSLDSAFSSFFLSFFIINSFRPVILDLFSDLSREADLLSGYAEAFPVQIKTKDAFLRR